MTIHWNFRGEKNKQICVLVMTHNPAVLFLSQPHVESALGTQWIGWKDQRVNVNVVVKEQNMCCCRESDIFYPAYRHFTNCTAIQEL
jgi:hypothetical protein